MEEGLKSPKEKILGIEELSKLTPEAIKELEAVVFCGFLTREDDETLYIADVQGTWVVSRKDTTFIEEWNPPSNLNSLRSTGRPVRVGLREGAIIQEIRPWQIKTGREVLGGGVHKDLQKIFSLGGSPLPVGERAFLGESQLRDMERVLSRRLGYPPDDPNVASLRAAGSATYVLNDGYCDADCAF